MFKGKKQGQFTAYVNLEGDIKYSQGKPVEIEIETGEIDPITGKNKTKTEFEKHEFAYMTLNRNYSKEEKPANAEDRESYFFFQNNYKKSDNEADWICKDKETKKLVGEIYYNDAKQEFKGKVNGMDIYIPVEDETQRRFQAFEGVQNETVVEPIVVTEGVTPTANDGMDSDEFPF